MIRLSPLAMRSKDYCSTTDTLAHLNPLLFDSQDPGKGNSLDIHQLIKREGRHHTYAQCNFIQSQQNEIIKFGGKSMELENILLSKITQAMKSKDVYFPSDMDHNFKSISVCIELGVSTKA